MTNNSSLLSFPFASQLDLLRAHHKDSLFLHDLLSNLQSCCAPLLSPSLFARLYHHLPIIVSFLYYLCTTTLGIPTLGEDYCQLTPVSSNGFSTPSIHRRILFLLLHIIRPSTYLSTLLSWIPSSSCRDTIPFLINSILSPLHLSLFYFTGKYYHISKRITGIRSIVLTKPPSDQIQLSSHFLGWMQVVKVVSLATLSTLRHFSSSSSISTSPSKVTTPQHLGYSSDTVGDCVLCMGPRSVSTVCPCGHIFCWDCIGTWVLDKPECPLCRQSCSPRDLLCVDY